MDYNEVQVNNPLTIISLYTGRASNMKRYGNMWTVLEGLGEVFSDIKNTVVTPVNILVHGRF